MEALPRRFRREDLVLAGRLALHADLRRRGRQPGEPDVRRAPGRVPVGPRGDRRALLRAPGRQRTCAATPTSASTTPGTRRPTASAWSTSGPGRSGCSSRSTPSRCAWTYGSAETAPGGPPIRCRRSRSWARSRWIPPAGCWAPRCAVPCTGCPAGTARPGHCSPEPGVRGRLPVVIPGADAVACASDDGGEDGLDVIPADGSAARRIGHGEFGRILELAVAPDGRTAAVACADGRLLTVALDGEPVITEIARSTNEEVTGLAFSPDSALLAWSQPWRPERGAVADTAGPAGRRHRHRRDPAPVRRHLAGVHPGRQVPGVPVEPRVRSGLRRALPGSRVPARGPAVPRDAAGHDAVAVRSGAEWPSGRTEGPGEARDRERTAAGLDVAGLAERIVPFPVAAGRYDKLRAVRDGVVWLDTAARRGAG